MSVEVYWGSASRQATWMHESPKHGRETVAIAHNGGFWVRECCVGVELDKVARAVAQVWSQIRDGENPAEIATHRLIESFPTVYAPIEAASTDTPALF